MYKNKRILGLITARGGSKGLPNKNIKILNGKPLIAWSIEASNNSKFLDKLIVSTDSAKIAKVAKKYNADVPFIRPKYLATDTATSVDVVLRAIEFFEKKGQFFDYVILIEPTSPLRTSEDINNTIRALIDNKNGTAIVSVVKLESAHPDFVVSINEKGLIQPFLHDKGIQVKRRQELSDLYFPDGTIYISKIDSLKKRKTFYHELTIAFPIERYKQFEVDEEMDLVIIESIMKVKGYK